MIAAKKITNTYAYMYNYAPTFYKIALSGYQMSQTAVTSAYRKATNTEREKCESCSRLYERMSKNRIIYASRKKGVRNDSHAFVIVVFQLQIDDFNIYDFIRSI